ncbi:MAG: GNAT family N-acetyltransferase [Chloroflexaceae bacterium]|nr:GNAT family N-acetyltransferase [Chloroflexaceae bacterium]
MTQATVFHFPDPGLLRDNDLELVVSGTYPGNAEKGFVPEYRFDMVHAVTRAVMGTLDLRVGLTEQLKQYGGHIGYEVAEAHRGHNYAARSCRLLFPFIRQLGIQPVIITCNPANLASVKTIESLGGKLVATNNVEVEGGVQRLTSVYFLEVDMPLQEQVATLEHAMNAYVEGLRTGKLELLQTLFWGDGQFCVYVDSEEKILCKTFSEVLASWVETPDPEASGKIIAQELIEGVMGRVTYALTFHGKYYTDYLLLYLVDGKYPF